MKNNGLNVSFLTFISLGFLLSILLLFPVHDFVTFNEVARGFSEKIASYDSSSEYVLTGLVKSLQGKRLTGTIFFGFLGMLIGFVFYLAYKTLLRKNDDIDNIKQEMSREILYVLKKPESLYLEFKSSFRWDFKQHKINKALEQSVLKNIAAFLNTEGGALIIGVDDNGNAVGLEPDYQTLKTKNKDGFEMAVMAAISTKIGANYCHSVTLMFHDVEEYEICRIIVSKSSVPAYLHVGNNISFYLRAGAGARELNIKEATAYISSNWA